MFRNSTVFVLGAGASWHYGYPTGERLVESVISMAERFAHFCRLRLWSGQVIQLVPEYVENKRIDPRKGIAGFREAWEETQSECVTLIERLKAVRPLLIDHFLAWNESLRPIGKLMIAAVILECEAEWFREGGNHNRQSAKALKIDYSQYPDDWHRFIIHKLVYGCRKSTDLFLNDVHFVTFNYDASLEYHLHNALRAISLLEESDVDKFLLDDRIIHVYGSVHRGIPSQADLVDPNAVKNLGRPFGLPVDFQRDFLPPQEFLDRCLAASDNLRTIDPHDKEENRTLLDGARKWIAGASVIYILGYGFDENNNRRIGLTSSVMTSGERSVMFTNFGDVNAVNKRASRGMLGSHENFLRETTIGHPNRRYFEKSVRNVYEALEKDFETLEGDAIASTKS
jgi:hypothetical protein